jgi:hypothetical protein
MDGMVIIAKIVKFFRMVVNDIFVVNVNIVIMVILGIIKCIIETEIFL